MSDHTQKLSVADSRRRVAIGSLVRSALLVFISLAGLVYVFLFALVTDAIYSQIMPGIIGFTFVAVVFAVDVVVKLVQLAMNSGPFSR